MRTIILLLLLFVSSVRPFPIHFPSSLSYSSSHSSTLSTLFSFLFSPFVMLLLLRLVLFFLLLSVDFSSKFSFCFRQCVLYCSAVVLLQHRSFVFDTIFASRQKKNIIFLFLSCFLYFGLFVFVSRGLFTTTTQ